MGQGQMEARLRQLRLQLQGSAEVLGRLGGLSLRQMRASPEEIRAEVRLVLLRDDIENPAGLGVLLVTKGA